MSDPTFLKLNILGFGIPALDSRMAAIEIAECLLWVEHSPQLNCRVRPDQTICRTSRVNHGRLSQLENMRRPYSASAASN
jgi:hypothetical protein